MLRLSVLGTAFCIYAGSAAAAGAGSDVMVGVSFRAAFGASERMVYSVQGGSSLTLPDELEPFQQAQSLPLSGISYAADGGLSPVLLGIPLAEAASSHEAAAGDQGIPWGWVGAGAAIIAGLALAGGSDHSNNDGGLDDAGEQGTRNGSGVTDENTCVMGRDGAAPDVDADCARNPHGPL